jgi:hypothetical protein
MDIADLVRLKSWSAPLYWQPSPSETQPFNATKSSGPDNVAAATAHANSLVFVGMTPCRVVDTRNGSGFSGAFGAPGLMAAKYGAFLSNPVRRVQFPPSLSLFVQHHNSPASICGLRNRGADAGFDAANILDTERLCLCIFIVGLRDFQCRNRAGWNEWVGGCVRESEHKSHYRH